MRRSFLLLLICLGIQVHLSAQLDFGLIPSEPNIKYMDCAAIFLNGEMLVDDFSPKGKCQLKSNAQGRLTVSTVALDEKGGTAIKPIEFRVAIKNKRTNTLYMYSPKTYMELDIQDAMRRCNKGDKILIMTTNDRYNLSHHEIDVEIIGC